MIGRIFKKLFTEDDYFGYLFGFYDQMHFMQIIGKDAIALMDMDCDDLCEHPERITKQHVISAGSWILFYSRYINTDSQKKLIRCYRDFIMHKKAQ